MSPWYSVVAVARSLSLYPRRLRAAAHRRLAPAALLAFLAGNALHAQTPLPISTVDDLLPDLAAVPCDNGKRLDAVRALFEGAGAKPEDIRIEDDTHVRNLVVRKPGLEPGTIIIGAHYDKARAGCGAVDNWTGQVVLTRVFRTLAAAPMRRTLVFVAFGREEEGLVGSRAMAEAIPKDQRQDYCAMVNLDSFGRSGAQVLDNASSPPLRSLAADLAQRMNIPFSHAAVKLADSDSTSFKLIGIPAVTLHGLSGDFGSILHSRRDEPSIVNPVSVHLGYRLALGMVGEIDRASCDAFR